MTLREWIAAQGLTQREAAERLDVHEITLNRWVMGHTIPRRGQMARIREVTNGSVPYASFLAADDATAA